MNELEEKVTMLEELIQGFVKRMDGVEKEMPDFLRSFLSQYKQTLEKIAERIETANQRYDDQKIQQQIDAVSKMISTAPKVIDVKNHHHFGAWSRSLIIGVICCFVLTASSIGTALYLNHRNDRLNNEAYNFWLVRALYPEAAKTIEQRLKEDPQGFVAKAEQEMERQQAIIAAKAVADDADEKQRQAKEHLEKAKLGK